MLQRSPYSPATRPPLPSADPSLVAHELPGQVAVQSTAAQRAAGSFIATLEVTLQRLEEVLDQETSALRAGGSVDLQAFNGRKSQALLELTRMLRHAQGGAQDPHLVKRIGAIQSKLAINQAVLKMHLEAVREVSNTIADAIRAADSDGTYTPAISSVHALYRQQ